MITVHPGAQRHHWNNEWLDSWQSFPATGNYDLVGNAHGVLIAHNDDTIDPGEGFDRHQHSEAEILSWVLQGAVEHRDSQGNSGILRPGHIQRMTTGTGISHSEQNAMPRSSRTPTRVVQMWLLPDTPGLPPSYSEADLAARLADGELVLAASGRPGTDPAVTINNRYASLYIARLKPGQRVTLPGAPFGHLYVPDGRLAVADVDAELTGGDAVRFTDAPATEVTAVEPTELLYWEMHASPVSS